MTINRRFAPAAAVLLSAWATTLATPKPVSAGLFSISESDEIKAGQQLRVEAQKQYGPALPDSDPMSVRVRNIGAQFARLSTRRNLPYTFQVLANDTVLNAFSGPGGPVFATRKLVRTTSNDAELAYVLGHETAHIEHKDVVNSAAKQQKAGLLVGILGALLTRGQSSSAVGAVANVGLSLWSSGFSRQEETNADITGVRWMSQLGYDPRASLTMLSKLDDGNNGGLQKYLATHPAPKDRQAKLNQLIASESLLGVAQRAGGPKLWANGLVRRTGYDPNAVGSYSNGLAGYPSGTYPGGAATYPTAGTAPTAPAYYPPVADRSSQQEVQFGAPLVLVARGNAQVVMAPVGGLAQWSAAQITINPAITLLRRGDHSVQLRRHSTVAYLSGRAVTLTAAAEDFNGQLYAPLGAVVDGLGGAVTISNDGRLVWLTLDGQQSGFVRLP